MQPNIEDADARDSAGPFVPSPAISNLAVGELVPIPTLPFCKTVKTEEPLRPLLAVEEEMAKSAERATRGEYFETGKAQEKRRRKDVRMNTEVRNVEEKKAKSSKRRKT